LEALFLRLQPSQGTLKSPVVVLKSHFISDFPPYPKQKPARKTARPAA
jgi:hypothetical protein